MWKEKGFLEASVDAVYRFAKEYSEGSVKSVGTEPFIGDVLHGREVFSPGKPEGFIDAGMSVSNCQRILSSLSELRECQKSILKLDGPRLYVSHLISNFQTNVKEQEASLKER